MRKSRSARRERASPTIGWLYARNAVLCRGPGLIRCRTLPTAQLWCRERLFRSAHRIRLRPGPGPAQSHWLLAAGCVAPAIPCRARFREPVRPSATRAVFAGFADRYVVLWMGEGVEEGS